MRVCKAIIIIVASFAIKAQGQVNCHGIPDIKNYTIDIYQGEEQNWSIVKDKRGIYYVGKTSEGVMEYDGTNWNKIPLPQKVLVRSLTVGNDGIVYVGAVGEIGRLLPNHYGKLEYQSLIPFFRDTLLRKDFSGEVYKVYAFNNKVYFATREIIAIFDGDSISAINMGKSLVTGNFLTFLVDTTFYIGSYIHGLHYLTKDSIQKVPNSKILAQKNIFSMLPYGKDTILIATSNSEFFLFNLQKNQFTPFPLKGKTAQFLKTNGGYLYTGTALANGNFGFGYVLGGKCSFIEVDRKGNIKTILNTNYGLNDESVTFAWQESNSDNEKPLLWLTLNNGISSIDLHSPLKKFDEKNGFVGIILDIIKHKDRLYLATMSGLYVSTIDESGSMSFKPVANIKSTTWSLLNFSPDNGKDEILLAGTGSLDGVFQINGDYATRIFPNPDKHQPSLVTRKLLQSKKYPNRVYIVLEGGITWIEWKNGRWITSDRAYRSDQIKGDFRSIAEDSKGRLWLGWFLKGAYRFDSFNVSDSLIFYDKTHGMPEYFGQTIENIDGKVYFGSDNGFYEFNETTDQIVPTNDFGNVFQNRIIYKIIRTPSGFAFAETSENRKMIGLLTKNTNEDWTIYDLPFRTIPAVTSDALYYSDQILYIGTSTNLFIYQMNDTLRYNRLSHQNNSFNVSFRKIVAGDSLLNGGTFFINKDNRISILSQQPESHVPQIKYSQNNLIFEYSALYFLNPEKTQYSYKLKGYREQWSDWNNETKREFTNLSEGTYIFQVKARNVYGLESNIASYSFEILPPWYRTIFAYIGYIILALGIMALTIKLYTRRLIAEKERLERIVAERTAEVVAQKEEIQAQSEKIFHQNEQIKSSITYASKIQGAVLPPDETISQIFPDHFILYLPRDIVSGDFYWVAEIEGIKYCAVADCTGHGVPGGFMSMMGISFLNQIVGQKKNLTAAEILFQLRRNIISSLHQTGKVGENKDGMDIAFYIIDPSTHKCQFAGANNPLVLIRNNEAIVYKADKMPIGIYIKGEETFTNYEFELEDGDVLYTFSDGYIDQFGGPDGRKFMSKNFRELLLEIHQNPMEKQKEILHQTLLNWHGKNERVDDVVVMGFRYHKNINS
ncbi:MAG TPA: SpoIIE family protein phosphatase [Salinivirgaceae bacterium]|nr:SpoIIE family protein phosphatase [Salinivirgaceae bacterium]